MWFEVEVLEATGAALVGFAGTNFRGTPEPIVGIDAISWSVYSQDGKSVHGSCPPPSPPASARAAVTFMR